MNAPTGRKARVSVIERAIAASDLVEFPRDRRQRHHDHGKNRTRRASSRGSGGDGGVLIAGGRGHRAVVEGTSRLQPVRRTFKLAARRSTCWRSSSSRCKRA